MCIHGVVGSKVNHGSCSCVPRFQKCCSFFCIFRGSQAGSLVGVCTLPRILGGPGQAPTVEARKLEYDCPPNPKA